jgi:heme-degrading monooxygenase HmoA
MFMRITWGRIATGRWNDFETAYKEVLSREKSPVGLKHRWLVRDRNDGDAGYSVSLWETEAALRAYAASKERAEATARLKPYFIDEFTVTDCEVRAE